MFATGAQSKSISTSDTKRQKLEVEEEGIAASGKRQFFVELFSGSGNLSRALADSGFNVVAIDWHNRHQVSFAPIALDLASDSGQEVMWMMVKTLKPDAIHAGVPHGTVSRAREKQIPHRLRAQGKPTPAPLRSAEWPLGLPNLSATDQKRVSQDNRLFYLVFELILYSVEHSILFTVENPRRSWFWAVLVAFAKQHSLYACEIVNRLFTVTWDACMHGDVRKATKRIDCTQNALQALAAPCDAAHEHEPLTAFTSDAGRFQWAYPVLLCRRWAQALIEHLKVGVLPPRPDLRLQTTALGFRQSRRNRQLIPEFLKIFDFDLANKPLPPLCKKLGPSLHGEKSMGLFRVGMFHSMSQFVDKSLLLKHPLDTMNPVPDSIKLAIFNILTLGSHEVASRRASALKKALLLKQQLAEEEEKLHRSWPEHKQIVLRGKSILLFQKLLQITGYDDLEVVNFMLHGVELTGHHSKPVYADMKVVPATSTREQLETEALWRRKALMTQPCDVDTFEFLDEQTQAEVTAGFLQGPFSEEQISAQLGRCDWVLNPRFLLMQGQGPQKKPRIIDDCKKSGLNNSFTSVERLQLQDFDFVVAVTKLLGSCVKDGQVTMALATGEVLEAGLHPSMRGQRWLARTLDLAKAYKQMCIACSSRHLAVVGYPAPSTDGWKFYLSSSIPFGAVGSVFGFLRVARAIWFLAVVYLGIPCCHYFDDFPHFETESLASSSRLAFEGLLKLIGWRFAEGEKNLPFADHFNILGATIDLSSLPAGFFTVQNKPGRMQHIAELTRNLKESEAAADLAVVRGHVTFASGFCLGRFLQPAAREIGLAFASSSPMRGDLIQLACDKLLSLLERSKPKTISCFHEGPPIVVFTDSAFEGGVATAGALVIDPLRGPPLVFDGVVPHEVVSKWMEAGSKQVISQAELFVLVCMRVGLKHSFHRRKVLFFADNEAARFAIIKATSGSSSMQQLASAFHECDCEHECFHWIERVPSASNPADLPTRNRTKDLLDLVKGQYAGSVPFDASLINMVLSAAHHDFLFELSTGDAPILSSLSQ